MNEGFIVCPGCGLRLLSADQKLDQQYNASTACRKLCYELSGYTLSLQDEYFIHQLVVDTYAAQHVGEMVKPISTTFALIGLCLVFKHNYTGKQVQRAHMILANKTKEWPRFTPPKEKSLLTVLDVVDVQDDEKKNMIVKWGKSVWDTWKPEHAGVAQLLHKYLNI